VRWHSDGGGWLVRVRAIRYRPSRLVRGRVGEGQAEQKMEEGRVRGGGPHWR
jgi:hypothetical protein